MRQILQKWLSIQCGLISGSVRAVALLEMKDRGNFEPVALWPEAITDSRTLRSVANVALKREQPYLQKCKKTKEETGEPLDIVSIPLYVDKHLMGAIAVEMARRPPTRQYTVIQQLQSGGVWLETMIHQQSMDSKEQLLTLVELMATSLEHEGFQAAATGVVTNLATRFSCERVSIGFLRGQRIQVDAISNNAGFQSRSNLVKNIGNSMFEAIDQEETIIFPDDPTQSHVTRDHARLAKKNGTGSICTVPFAANKKMTGALIFERSEERPFAQKTINQCQQIAALIGPVLEVRRRDDRMLPHKALDSFKTVLTKLLGPRHISLKLGTATIIALSIFLSLSTGMYRITAPASLTAEIKRVIVAPQQGFIAGAAARPGDIVRAGNCSAPLTIKICNWNADSG